MSYLIHLKKVEHHKDCRWIVKYNKNKVREVKLIFNPKEYKGRELYTKEQLIEILEKNKNEV